MPVASPRPVRPSSLSTLTMTQFFHGFPTRKVDIRSIFIPISLERISDPSALCAEAWARFSLHPAGKRSGRRAREFCERFSREGSLDEQEVGQLVQQDVQFTVVDFVQRRVGQVADGGSADDPAAPEHLFVDRRAV